MKTNKYVCEKCGSEINSYNFFTDYTKKKFFCSRECCKEYYYETDVEDYIHVSTCGGYYDCKKLNNIDGRCRTVNEINFSPLYGISAIDIPPNRCPPAEISIIRTNMKLFDSVKQSEEKSSKLNEKTLNLTEKSLELNSETLKLTKSNVTLAKAMLILTAINVIGICVQIYFQIFGS